MPQKHYGFELALIIMTVSKGGAGSQKGVTHLAVEQHAGRCSN
jgi:hypothetical protein